MYMRFASAGFNLMSKFIEVEPKSKTPVVYVMTAAAEIPH